ncbi:cytochrome P450 [Sedimentitalea sp. XS_ASV28]|uniref:cytochrome P450 n=1 Tax=Sedimentitalea sp. XS_ASV28 TaxID=3241296 RepID=UPI003513C7EF
MPGTLRDIPDFPAYVEGQTDHEYMAAAWAQGPLARNRLGIISGFSLANMDMINDDRWTRQLELEGMFISGVRDGPMFEFQRNALLFSNGQVHRNRRGPLVRSFATRVIAEMRPAIAARITSLIAPLRGAGSVDFVEHIAGPYPAQVIAALIGAPEADTSAFARHVYSAIRGLSHCSDEVRAESDMDMAELDSYVAGLIEQRRASPEADFLSTYLGRVADGPLSEDEIRAQLAALVLAGSDTTRGALASTVSQLLLHPEQWALLVQDPERWATPAVLEGLRYDPMIGSLPRITLEPREIEGILIPKGSFVAVSMLTALRDPDVYADPDSFDITRSDHPRLHPVFGGGPHRCLGEALARVELEEALKALARLVPDMRLDGPPVTLRGYGAVRSLSDMRVLL